MFKNEKSVSFSSEILDLFFLLSFFTVSFFFSTMPSFCVSCVNTSILVWICAHLLMAGWWCKQRYYSDHDCSESTQQDGEMEVVNAAENHRCWIFKSASGRREGELQHHPTHTDHQTHHEAPECPLKEQKHTQHCKNWIIRR